MKKRLLFLLSLLVLVFDFGLVSCTFSEEVEGETEGDEIESEEEKPSEPVQLNAVTIVIDSTNDKKIDWSASVKGVGGIAYYTLSFDDEQYLEPTEDSNTVVMVISTNDSEEY